MHVKTRKLGSFGLLVEPVRNGENLWSLDIEPLRALFQKEHLLVLRGFSTFADAETFADYCERWGTISLWPFGKVLELVEKPNPEDHIFDSNYVPLHWDGMYRPEVPEIQLFHCVRAPESSQGGRTTFSNTALAYEHASSQERKRWSTLMGVYERKMEFYHSRSVAPVICEHPTRGYPVIRFCEPPKEGDSNFINHPFYEFKGIAKTQTNEFVQIMRRALYSPDNFYAHAWQTGDVVVSDNHTLLHGREAFVSGAPRHLRRVHVLGKPPLKNPHLEFHQ